MVQTKNMTVLVKYNGTTDYNEQNKQVKFHYFLPLEKNKQVKWIRIREDNPIISALTLKEGGKYELNWIEKDKKPKRVFRKHDNIVVVDQEKNNDNNDKQAEDCPTCLSKIDLLINLCEEWEITYKTNLENIKKEKCFCGKGVPALLKRSGEVKEHKSECPKCQKEYVSSKSNGVGDKTTLTHDCSQKPNDEREDDNEPQDNHDHDNKKSAEVGEVRKYCKDNDVKKLEYDEDTGKLVIVYAKTDKPKKELTDLTEELEGIKEYLKEKGKKDKRKRYLNSEDWEEYDRQRGQNPKFKESNTNYTPWIIAGCIGLFIIVLIAVIGLVRKSD